MRRFWLQVVLVCACTVILPAQTPGVPIPTQLAAAQTIFVANNGGTDNAYSQAVYGDLYQDLVAYKRFTLAQKPGDAELGFELSIRTVQPFLYPSVSNPPVLRLDIRDIKTGCILWSLQELVKGNVKDNDVAIAVSKLLADFDSLIHGAPPESGGTKKQRFQQEKP